MAEKVKKNSEKNIAETMGEKQRNISVAEFFEKNRHLLGFDNKRKALMTTIKEAVDNALDACEEARILPEIIVEIIDMQNDRFRIVVEDNGPGIVKKQIPNIFARLLYGSKFHTMKQQRGQQGIGISAAALYGQLTTGRPIRITSRIGKDHPAHYFELHIDTQTNLPQIVKDDEINWHKERGTRIELDLEGSYQKGGISVDEYLKQTAIVNPHTTIIYTNPKAEQFIFPRATDELPKEAKEIKPHPYGVELGMLLKMAKNTESRTMQSFLSNDFSRVGAQTGKEIIEKAGILPNFNPNDLQIQQADRLMQAIRDTKIMAPPTDCISPIGENLLERGLKKEVQAEFYVSVTRPPEVYRGNPFVIECAIAYGGNLAKDESVTVLRFANRVPLLYQPGSCATTKSIMQTNWKSYGLSQSGSSLPVGPAVIMVHVASVWPPFTSEAKEAIAHYPEIIKEIKLALQECGRKLGIYVNKKKKVGAQLERASLFEKYIPEIADSLSVLSGEKKQTIIDGLNKMTNKEEIQKAIKGDDNVEYAENDGPKLKLKKSYEEDDDESESQDKKKGKSKKGKAKKDEEDESDDDVVSEDDSSDEE